MMAISIEPIGLLVFLHLLYTIVMTSAIALMLWFVNITKASRLARGDIR